MSNNPLASHIARPGVWVRLPSGGEFYKDTPDVNTDGELEVRPLTAVDELYLKNPDALFNSEGLYQCIKNSVRGIKDPADIPSPDLDVIIIGMRLATYGQKMGVTPTCPHCEQSNTYDIDLPGILSQVKPIDLTKCEVTIDDLTVVVRPYTSASNTQLSQYTAEVNRAAIQMQRNTASEKQELFESQLKESIAKSNQLLISLTTSSIQRVIMEDGTIVDEPEFIDEWVASMSAPTYRKVRDAIVSVSENTFKKSFKYQCINPACNEINEVDIDFDPAAFFADNSAEQ